MINRRSMLQGVLGAGAAGAAVLSDMNSSARAQDYVKETKENNMSSQASLKLVQEFVRAIEERDRATIERIIAENARQIFPMGSNGWEGLGAVFEGKAEVLEYTFGLFDNFDSLVWVNKVWTVSGDGTRVFLQAKSDCIVAHSKAPYHNTYVTRFDVADGQITQILEYAISELFVATGIPLGEAMKKAIARAQSLPEDTSVK